MGIPNQWALMFFRHRELFAARSSGESWLSLGTLDYEVKPEVEKQLGFSGSCASLFGKLGYSRYAQMDINAQADVVWDLNKPIPDHHGEFDFIYDGGTIEHILNPFQGCVNVLTMAKVGGRIAHSQGVGDTMGHGYWTFTPEFVRDFYTANGCRLLSMFLMDLKNNEYSLASRQNDIPGLLGYLPKKAVRNIGLQIVKRSYGLPFSPGDLNYSLIAVFEKMRETKSINTTFQAAYADTVVTG